MTEEAFCRELNDAIAGGVPIRDIAERIGVHESTIEQWRRKAPRSELFRKVQSEELRKLIQERGVDR